VALEIHQFPCLEDNYGFLVREEISGATACIDTPDADVILAQLARKGWELSLILNTHWHRDHAGGNAALKAKTGALAIGPREVARIAPLDRVVADGESVSFGATRLRVIETAGHTLGHVCYYEDASAVAFVGDTLFALGCGRLFEGTADQMWASLRRLASLPPATRVYCAHEYTAANARFALSVGCEPDLQARAREVFAARERGEPTVPTTIGAELRTNPFLRAPDAQSFAQLRRAKDAFQA